MFAPMDSETARTLARQAQAARGAGNGDAIALQRQAVAAFAEIGDAAGHAHALRHLADILSESGDAEAAAPLFETVLAFYAGAGTPIDAANAIRGTALNAERLGRRDEAKRLWALARDCYAALDAWFAERIGAGENPGVAEADRHLAALGG